MRDMARHVFGLGIEMQLSGESDEFKPKSEQKKYVSTFNS